MEDYSPILSLLPKRLCALLEEASLSEAEELRLRAERSSELCTRSGVQVLSCVLTAEELCAVVAAAAGYSLYAREGEIASGYLTLRGGHRVGFTGRCMVNCGKIEYMEQFSSVNIRFARELVGCCENVLPYIFERGQVVSSLILSAPGIGKTTLLRDIARSLGERGMKLAVIDERSELAAMYQAVPSLNVGRRTDVLDGAPKAAGMELVIRSMSPQVVVTDEIGSPSDAGALLDAASRGVLVLASAHAATLFELRAKPYLKAVGESGVFSRFIFIERRSQRLLAREVYDAGFSLLYPAP